MVNAGLKTDDACITTFTELKLGKKHRYFVCAIKDNTIQIEKVVSAKDDFKYNEFVSYLSDCDGPRFAVLDYEFSEDQVSRSKIIFFFWCPDSAPIRKKMMYASAKEHFQRGLTGVHKSKQINDASDMEESEIRQMCMK